MIKEIKKNLNLNIGIQPGHFISKDFILKVLVKHTPV